MPTPRRALGTAGEGHARRYFEAKGWHFIAANWRWRGGELDLIMRDGDELVFIEVKTRHGERAGRAEEAISPAQARRLLAAATAFIAEYPVWAEAIWRIDILAITLAADGHVLRVMHFDNAITAEGPG